MGYTMAADMGLADFAVKAAIKQLSERQTVISHEDIANLIGCGIATVNRTVPRLIDAGLVVREGSKRNGYVLRVNDEQRNN